MCAGRTYSLEKEPCFFESTSTFIHSASQDNSSTSVRSRRKTVICYMSIWRAHCIYHDVSPNRHFARFPAGTAKTTDTARPFGCPTLTNEGVRFPSVPFRGDGAGHGRSSLIHIYYAGWATRSVYLGALWNGSVSSRAIGIRERAYTTF
jgi:hypothetical protein